MMTLGAKKKARGWLENGQFVIFSLIDCNLLPYIVFVSLIHLHPLYVDLSSTSTTFAHMIFSVGWRLAPPNKLSLSWFSKPLSFDKHSLLAPEWFSSILQVKCIFSFMAVDAFLRFIITLVLFSIVVFFALRTAAPVVTILRSIGKAPYSTSILQFRHQLDSNSIGGFLRRLFALAFHICPARPQWYYHRDVINHIGHIHRSWTQS